MIALHPCKGASACAAINKGAGTRIRVVGEADSAELLQRPALAIIEAALAADAVQEGVVVQLLSFVLLPKLEEGVLVRRESLRDVPVARKQRVLVAVVGFGQVSDAPGCAGGSARAVRAEESDWGYRGAV